MEKKQYELCLEVLRRLDKSGALKNMLLIDSWYLPFYKEYFTGLPYSPAIKTRDIDFLIPNASRIKTRIDMAELLKDLGFVVGHKGTKGYMRLEHPDLIIELLEAGTHPLFLSPYSATRSRMKSPVFDTLIIPPSAIESIY